MKNLTLLAFLVLALNWFGCKDEDPEPEQQPTDSTAEPYVPVEVEDDWYEVTYVEPRTYIIEEPSSAQGNVSYLILGDDRAVMFDTGAGENNAVGDSKVMYLIEQITDLPVTLLMSHFHFDHNQNISEFDHVAFIELDYLVEGTSEEGIYTFSTQELVEGSYPESVEVDEWWTPDSYIDLGNRTIRIVSIPGHTDESAMIVDNENKLMFMGDYLYNGTLFIFGEDNVPVYETTVDMLIANYDDSYTMYGAHGAPAIPHTDLQGLKDILICIEDGSCTPGVFNLWGYLVYHYELGDMSVWLFT